MTDSLLDALRRARRLAYSHDTSTFLLVELAEGLSVTFQEDEGFMIGSQHFDVPLIGMHSAATKKDVNGNSISVDYCLLGKGGASEENLDLRTAFRKLAGRLSDVISIDEVRRLGFRSTLYDSDVWLYYLLHSPEMAERIQGIDGVTWLTDPIVASVELKCFTGSGTQECVG